MSPGANVTQEEKESCRGCEKPMVWGYYWQDAEGDQPGKEKRIPLDPSSPVYRIVKRNPDGKIVVARDKDAMVSHFKTCPRADLFARAGSDRKSSPLGDPGVGDLIRVIHGVFKGLEGRMVRKTTVGESNKALAQLIGFWLEVRDADGQIVGLCQVGPGQVETIEKGVVPEGTCRPGVTES